MARLTDVVVPLDSSSMAETILPLVRVLAKRLGLKITLVNAIPTAAQLYWGTELIAEAPDILEGAEESAGQYLDGVVRRLKAEDGLDAEWEILHGHAGQAIVEFSRNLNDNLVAMSTRGRSGVGRWVLGSVTDKVVRSSGDPVLVLRPPDP